MRIKNKIHCSKCGKFLRELSKEEMEKVNKDKLNGSRTNCDFICNSSCCR